MNRATPVMLFVCCRQHHSVPVLKFQSFNQFLQWFCCYITLSPPPHFLYSGGVESDGPPKKLFVAGVTDPAHITSYTVRWVLQWCLNKQNRISCLIIGSTSALNESLHTCSVSQSVDSSSGTAPVGSITQATPLSLSPPPPFTSHHPSI